MDWILTGIPAWITALSALFTAGAAVFAALQYWDSRSIKRGLDDYEWDVLKAVGETSSRGELYVSLNDLTHYIQWKPETIEYDEHMGWMPQNVSLRFSMHYMLFCEVLVSREYLLCTSKERWSRKYELSPDGVRFVHAEFNRIGDRDYKGSYDDIVDRELKRRREIRNFQSEVRDVDGNIEAIDIVCEFPPAQHDPLSKNPCDVLCMVVTSANKSLIEAPIGTNTVVSIGNTEDSLYLQRGICVSARIDDGRMLCGIVYKHRRDNECLDVWLTALLSASSAKGIAEILLAKQNRIRDAHYKLPPLEEAAYEPVSE